MSVLVVILKVRMIKMSDKSDTILSDYSNLFWESTFYLKTVSIHTFCIICNL